MSEIIEQNENEAEVAVDPQPTPNEFKAPMDELLDTVLAQLGKTRDEFEKDVENERKFSSVEQIGGLMALLMQNAEVSAMMVGVLMGEIEVLKTRIDELEGGAA